MAEIHDPVETGMPRSVRLGIIAVVVIIVFIWLLPRRVSENGNNPTAGATPSPTSGQSSESPPSGVDRKTERELQGILRGLSPTTVVISSPRLDRVAELTQWASSAFQKGDAATITIDAAANEKWFTGDALREVNDPTFSLRDGHHITMASLAGEIVTRLSQKTADPVEQIHELFAIVVRETILMPDSHDAQLPGTPFESLLIGRGTAAGRAWALATLLRQLRIDAVVLEPKSKPEAWLIGVIAPAGDVLLFDPRLGCAVPSEASPSGFQNAASLKQVVEKPELLKQLDVEGAPYPLTGDDLAALSVKMITDSSAASLRMARLQTLITGTVLEVFDGLGKNPIREQGLVERIVATGAKGHWTAGDLSVWSYPEQQSEAFMSSGAEDSPAWKDLTAVLAGPIELGQQRKQTRSESDASSETIVQRSRNPLRLVRVIHLSGRITEAIKDYGPVQSPASNLRMTANPELQARLDEARPMNRRTAELACYWTALCQSQVNPKVAIDTLNRYLREYPQGTMLAGIPELYATSLYRNGQRDEAVSLLEKGRRTPRLELLLKQWKATATDGKPPE
jgi:hypothetical protein